MHDNAASIIADCLSSACHGSHATDLGQYGANPADGALSGLRLATRMGPDAGELKCYVEHHEHTEDGSYRRL